MGGCAWLGAQAAYAVKASAIQQPHVRQAPNPAAAFALARELAGPDDLICITGSFFLAAELRPLVAQGKVEALND